MSTNVCVTKHVWPEILLQALPREAQRGYFFFFTEMTEYSTFARWAFVHYFTFVRDKDKKNVLVKCNLCPNPTELSPSRNSTSNLKKHLKRCHATTQLTENRKKTGEESDQSKQLKLSFTWSAIMPLEP